MCMREHPQKPADGTAGTGGHKPLNRIFCAYFIFDISLRIQTYLEVHKWLFPEKSLHNLITQVHWDKSEGL